MSNTVTEEQQLQDLQKRMLGKSKAEQADMLRSYMNETLGVKPEAPAVPVAQFSEDQFARLSDSIVSEARKVAGEAATEIEKKYDLNRGHAADAADDAVSKFYREQTRKEDENRIIGKR